MKGKPLRLNYCRQLSQQAASMIAIPSLPKEKKAEKVSLIDLCQRSTKFILPDGGLLFFDKQHKGLDRAVPLRLPFQSIALEYRDYSPSLQPRVIFAREWDADLDEDITIPKTSDRDHLQMTADEMLKKKLVVDIAFKAPSGEWQMIEPKPAFFLLGLLPGLNKDGYSDLLGMTPAIHKDDLNQEIANDVTCVLSQFLNALSCSNVRIEQQHEEKTPKAKKGRSPALAFDSYHVLTIDTGLQEVGAGPAHGAHRSPREHIRRGHIRVYPSGIKVWIQAHVVGRRSGAGKITKDYMLRNSSMPSHQGIQ